MAGDILAHRIGQQLMASAEAIHRSACLSPYIRGANLDFELRQQIKRRRFSRDVAERKFSQRDLHRASNCRCILCDRQSLRQNRRQIFKPLPRSRRNDQWSYESKLCAPMPAAKSDQRVGPHQCKESCRRKLFPQARERVDGVIGRSARVWSIGKGDGKLRKTLDGQLSHGHAIFKTGCRTRRLKWLNTYRGEEHGIEVQSLLGRQRYADVAQMRGVETASEEGNALSPARWLIHPFMLSRVSASMGFTMRYLIAVLALAGAVVSGLALQVHYTAGTSPCSINEKWDCGVVNHSSYSLVQGVPVALIGIIGYLVLLWLGMARQRAVLSIAAAVGLAFALYLAHIERDVLGVWCLYCVISLAIIAAITLLGPVWLIIAASQRRSRRW